MPIFRHSFYFITMKQRFLLTFIFLIVFQISFSQFLDAKSEIRLLQDVKYLASEQLQGRGTGTSGEKLAADFIAGQMKKIGLTPKGSNGYFQSFTINGDTKVSKAILSINGLLLEYPTVFYPLSSSGSGLVKNSQIVDVGFGIHNDKRKDYTNFESGNIALVNYSVPGGYHPHSEYADYINPYKKALIAQKFGASAVLFYNTDPNLPNPNVELFRTNDVAEIPLLFIDNTIAGQILEGGVFQAQIDLELYREKITGQNVIGFIDNKADYHIIICAHYDHLGFGEYGSLHKGENAIHYGADDNASGTAGLLELARFLKRKGPKNNNYLFIAFSGEELGLLGSKYFVKSELFEPKKANYVLNMDMIGRLNNEDKTLIINGVGTSSQWGVNLNGINIDGIKIKTSLSGVGPSDHTSFYLEGIPVLHFFTGLHNDYHKPSDTWEKINYKGMVSVLNFILQLIYNLDDGGKLDYQKTKEESSDRTRVKYSVSLGVLPDYTYTQGDGMSIDGVTDGKPAQRVGLAKGDIIVQLGEHKINDIKSYMEALGKFQKGDQTTLYFKRDGNLIEVKIEF